MSLELSTPVKAIALAGLVLAMLAGTFAAYTMAVRKHQSDALPAVVTHAQATQPGGAVRFSTKPTTAHPVTPVVVDHNLPGPLRNALLHSKIVVAAVWAPGVPGDADAVQAARSGAAAAHLHFTALNVKQEPVAAALAAWAPNAVDPAVLVVARPGRVLAELDGWADSDMVAQAALDAR